MSRNQETDLLAPHAAEGLIQTHDATAKMGGDMKGGPAEKPKKKKSVGGERMKYHKPTSKRRALQVRKRTIQSVALLRL